MRKRVTQKTKKSENMWLAAIVALVVAALLAEWLYFNLVHKTAPGPWGWPLVGSLPAFVRGQGQLVSVFARFGRENPMVFVYRMIGIGTIVQTNNADDVIHLLHGNFDNYPKPQLLSDIMGDLFGKDGIFVANGAAWTEQRKAGSKGFKLRSIRQSVEVFAAETHKAVQVLEGCDGQAVDVMKLVASLTLSAFTTLALSEENFSDVRLNDDSPFAFHFNRVVRRTANRFQNPFWKLGPAVWRGERELRESLAYIDERIFAVVAKARRRTGEEPEDMISSFLEYIPAASDRYLRDILMNFILAGRGEKMGENVFEATNRLCPDTTAVTLAMCLHYLAENPRVQEQLFAEVSRADCEVPSYEQADSFPYLYAVLRETLRLAPAVPVDPKVALADDVLPGSGVRVRKGDNVEWCAWNIHRKTEYYGADAEQFRPERWLDEDSTLPTTNRPPFVPFQFGPRTCLGMRMALVDMTIAMFVLAKRFRFESVGFQPVTDVQVSLVLNEVRVKVVVRK